MLRKTSKKREGREERAGITKEIPRFNEAGDFSHLLIFSVQKICSRCTGPRWDAIQRAVVLRLAVVGALLYGTLDAMVGTTGFHIESLLSFDRFYDGVMASC